MLLSRRELLKKGSVFGLVGALFGGKLPEAKADEGVQVLPKGAPVHIPGTYEEPLRGMQADSIIVDEYQVMGTGEWAIPEYGQVLINDWEYDSQGESLSAQDVFSNHYDAPFGTSVEVARVPEPGVKFVTITSNFAQPFMGLGQLSLYEDVGLPTSIDIEIEYIPENDGSICTEKYICAESDMKWIVDGDNNPIQMSVDGMKYDSLDFYKTYLNGLYYNLHIVIDKTTTVDMKATLKDRTYTFDGIQGV